MKKQKQRPLPSQGGHRATSVPMRDDASSLEFTPRPKNLATALTGSAIQSSGTPAKDPLPAQQKPIHLYFINRWMDFAFIGGLSIATFVILRAFHSGARTAPIYNVAYVLMWLCNWPHFASTSYRLYHSKDNVRQYPLTALVIPWLILAAVVGSFLSPLLIAPFFVKLFMIWSPYHFSGQTVGITLIYARRAGFFVGRWQRLALSSFVFGTFISQTARSEVSPAGNAIYGIRYPGMGLPEWIVPITVMVMWAGGLAFLFFVGKWCWQNRRMIPLIVLLPAVAQYVWFIPGSPIQGFKEIYAFVTGAPQPPSARLWESFTEFVPFFHSLQYLLIAWSMQLKEKMDLKNIEPSRRYVVRETVRWFGLNMVVGATLFYLIPRLLTNEQAGIPFLFAEGIVVTGIQVHHFFVDGVIWKLKRKTVASPLMVNISDLLARTPQTPVRAA